MNRALLAERVRSGAPIDFLFFWGHTPKSPDRVDASCLSQWFPAPFLVDGLRYATAEHFMMAEKARLFSDEDMAGQILSSTDPAKAKQLGRKVRDFDAATWNRSRVDIVVRGNVAKFSSAEPLRSYLLSTGERVLVEASPRDRIWGIGMGRNNPNASQPDSWRGENLLGFALMRVRETLRGG